MTPWTTPLAADVRSMGDKEMRKASLSFSLEGPFAALAKRTRPKCGTINSTISPTAPDDVAADREEVLRRWRSQEIACILSRGDRLSLI